MKQKKVLSLRNVLALAGVIALAGVFNHAASAEDFPAAKNQYIIEFTEQARSNPSKIGIKGAAALMAADPQNSFSPVSVIEIDSSGAMVAPSKNPVIANMPENPEFCMQLVASGAAKSCSPNFKVKTQAVPNDPGVSSQYWHTAIDSQHAWDLTTGGDAAVVAVLDTGVDYRHPDLSENMWRNPGEIANNNIDDDGNGVVDDVFGFNGEKNSGDPLDDGDHGTHVAGIIGARGNNGVGVVGVNWRTKIMGLKFITSAGWGMLSDAIKGLDYLVMMKQRGVNIRVVNNSWGGGGYSKTLEDTIKRVNNAGIIFVAAAGNSGSDNDVLPQYPANYEVPNVVSVAASENGNALTSFSCFGHQTVHVSAPGSSILSTITNNRYESMSGTSMATPFVTGALTLLLSHEPSLTPAQAIARLLSSGSFQADQEGLTKTGKMLNVNNLVRNIEGAVPPIGEVCQYQSSQIAFAPPAAVQSAPIVIPASGATYYSNDLLALPFDFPFYGKSYRMLSINVNGVVQFENPDEAWAYRGGSFAPRFSIAPLYTYLFDYPAAAAPEGVRVKSTAGRVDIFWNFKHPWNPMVGAFSATLSLFPNGNIEMFISIPNDRLAKTLGYGSIVGIRGANLSNSNTITANNFPVVLRNNLAFRLERPQSCQSIPSEAITPIPATPTPAILFPATPTPIATTTATPTPTNTPDASMRASVTKLSIVGPGGKKSIVKTRGSYTVQVSNSKPGLFTLKASLNGQICAEGAELAATLKTNAFKIAMPKIGAKFKKLILSVDSVRAAAKITGDKAISSAQQKTATACGQIVKRLRQAIRTK